MFLVPVFLQRSGDESANRVPPVAGRAGRPGRRGRPLKMETAMQDIPSLTPERYRNYMNFLYNNLFIVMLKKRMVKLNQYNLEQMKSHLFLVLISTRKR